MYVVDYFGFYKEALVFLRLMLCTTVHFTLYRIMSGGKTQTNGYPFFKPLHRGALCQFPFRWIYYCHRSKSTGKETGKTHLCAVYVSNSKKYLQKLSLYFALTWKD